MGVRYYNNDNIMMYGPQTGRACVGRYNVIIVLPELSRIAKRHKKI